MPQGPPLRGGPPYRTCPSDSQSMMPHNLQSYAAIKGERTSLPRDTHGLLITHISAHVKVKWICAWRRALCEASAADPVLHHQGERNDKVCGKCNELASLRAPLSLSLQQWHTSHTCRRLVGEDLNGESLRLGVVEPGEPRPIYADVYTGLAALFEFLATRASPCPIIVRTHALQKIFPWFL